VEEHRGLVARLAGREYLADKGRQPLDDLKRSFRVIQLIFAVAVNTAFDGIYLAIAEWQSCSLSARRASIQSLLEEKGPRRTSWWMWSPQKNGMDTMRSTLGGDTV